MTTEIKNYSFVLSDGATKTGKTITTYNENGSEITTEEYYGETAEVVVSKYFSPYQIAALQRLELSLLQAGKPLGPAMTAAKTWLESVLLGWAIDPTPRPAEDFGIPNVTFDQASAEAVAGLQAGQNPET